MARTRLYRGGSLVREDFPVGDIPEYLAEAGSVVWLDLYRPEPEALDRVGREFGIHELALEDAGKEGQRPKIDRYRAHEFLSAYGVTMDRRSGELVMSELAVFVTPQALITVRKDDGIHIDDVLARWDDAPELTAQGVGFLLHGLLDHLVDGYFVAVQRLDDSIEDLEDQLFAEGATVVRQVQRRAYELRKSLVEFRRVVLPMREVVNTLMRPTLHVVSEPLVPYYQDVYDHVLRATEWTESLRDLVGSVMETNLSIQANRMNEIMKQVTSWAAIIAVPTAITGFYGQNLPFPGFGDHVGLLSSSALIVVATVLLFFAFRRQDWL
ncbi:magnesium transporter CorA family protein [Streptomyces millisiae]|uniref:Magnesium transporter CorA family protein n=1 Tax=Streptomyces millisiae TaxID=3075542 RepID=A0ABU2LY50_9ACTN|nr:magnesium transporter CorA family protein [Streptomyces sp. DSM 44918]MDT0322523.1 magnesium transporter CorA family protein [Streptomyces sp. DSM 44918]